MSDGRVHEIMQATLLLIREKVYPLLAIDRTSGVSGREIIDRRRKDRDLPVLPGNPSDWAPDQLINTLTNNWDVFGYLFKFSGRSSHTIRGWVNEIRDHRNQWAHQ